MNKLCATVQDELSTFISNTYMGNLQSKEELINLLKLSNKKPKQTISLIILLILARGRLNSSSSTPPGGAQRSSSSWSSARDMVRGSKGNYSLNHLNFSFSQFRQSQRCLKIIRPLNYFDRFAGRDEQSVIALARRSTALIAFINSDLYNQKKTHSFCRLRACEPVFSSCSENSRGRLRRMHVSKIGIGEKSGQDRKITQEEERFLPRFSLLRIFK